MLISFSLNWNQKTFKSNSSKVYYKKNHHLLPLSYYTADITIPVKYEKISLKCRLILDKKGDVSIITNLCVSTILLFTLATCEQVSLGASSLSHLVFSDSFFGQIFTHLFKFITCHFLIGKKNRLSVITFSIYCWGWVFLTMLMNY